MITHTPFIAITDPSLTVKNMSEIMKDIGVKWRWVSINIGIPSDEIESISKKHGTDASKCGAAAWEYWLDNHPAPSWTLLADALYENMEHDALKLLKQKYPVGKYYR